MTLLTRRDLLSGTAATALSLAVATQNRSALAQLTGGTKKKIRLGVIRADTHAYYYGIMLEKCDPLRL